MLDQLRARAHFATEPHQYLSRRLYPQRHRGIEGNAKKAPLSAWEKEQEWWGTNLAWRGGRKQLESPLISTFLLIAFSSLLMRWLLDYTTLSIGLTYFMCKTQLGINVLVSSPGVTFFRNSIRRIRLLLRMLLRNSLHPSCSLEIRSTFDMLLINKPSFRIWMESE